MRTAGRVPFRGIALDDIWTSESTLLVLETAEFFSAADRKRYRSVTTRDLFTFTPDDRFIGSHNPKEQGSGKLPEAVSPGVHSRRRGIL
jgi:hypothetical protein